MSQKQKSEVADSEAQDSELQADSKTSKKQPWFERLKHFIFVHKIILSVLIVVGLVLVFGPTIYANVSTRSHRYSTVGVPPRRVTLVLGAGVLPDGTPTPYLKQRLDTAVHLYWRGDTQKLLLSGDNSTKHYNEPQAMKRYVIAQGVPVSDIVLDYAGFNTYDSCYRAKAIFEVPELLVVTQGYHLPRAVMTCSGLGIKTDGVAATKEGRDFTITYIMREHISTLKALMQIWIKPNPTVLGKPEPIFSEGS